MLRSDCDGPQLSFLLHEGTREAHRTVERLVFVRNFLRGLVSRDAYCNLLHALYQVYQVMEEALVRHQQHPVVGPMCMSHHFRASALQRDLRYLGMPTAETILPSVEPYVERIRDIEQGEAKLLVAHCYTRYLGDLSGGQILRRVVSRALGLRDGGIAFYVFGDGSTEYVQRAKAEFRLVLDDLPLSMKDKAEIVEEAVNVFRYNSNLFRDLEGNASTTLLRLVNPFGNGA